MLGGVEITAKAREHAKEMLKTAASTPPAAAKSEDVSRPKATKRKT
jgi:hypothetical protein